MVDHHVEAGARGGTVAIVEGLHIQQGRQPVVLPTEDVLTRPHLDVPLLLLARVRGIEIHLSR